MHTKEQAPPFSRDGEALSQALEGVGCPICLVTQERMQRVMDHWRYDGFTDTENRRILVRAQGFCPRHTWQLAQIPAAFQLAQVYHDLLPQVLTDLDKLAQRQRTTRFHTWLKRFFPWRKIPEQTLDALSYVQCPFCKQQRDIEARLADSLASCVSAEPLHEKLSQSGGVCLPHFTLTYHAATNEGQREMLLTCQRACVQRLQEELEEMVRKHDYRFLQEQQGDEMTSWSRALELFAGHPGAR